MCEFVRSSRRNFLGCKLPSGFECNGDVRPIYPRAAARQCILRENEKKGFSAQHVGFLRSFTQRPTPLPLVLRAEALTGRLRSQW
jgi:hypothetical protein